LPPLARCDLRTRRMVKYSVIEPVSGPEKSSLQPGGILEKIFDIPAFDRATNPGGKDLYFGIVCRKEIDQWDQSPR
jgi:hypothetical protein